MDNYDDLVTFAHVLCAIDRINNVPEMLSYFEKPWKWQKEFDRWKALGGTLDSQVIGSLHTELEAA